MPYIRRNIISFLISMVVFAGIFLFFLLLPHNVPPDYSQIIPALTAFAGIPAVVVFLLARMLYEKRQNEVSGHPAIDPILKDHPLTPKIIRSFPKLVLIFFVGLGVFIGIIYLFPFLLSLFGR